MDTRKHTSRDEVTHGRRLGNLVNELALCGIGTPKSRLRGDVRLERRLEDRFLRTLKERAAPHSYTSLIAMLFDVLQPVSLNVHLFAVPLGATAIAVYGTVVATHPA
jgi:hypothetical protein